jgi:hypothetical protein
VVPVIALWLPILVAAVLVFLASFILHMVLPHHRSDFSAVPTEEAFRAAFGAMSLPPGEYFVPHVTGPADMKDPAYAAKMEEGPVLFMTVLPNGMMDMGKNLLGWFIYSLVVGVFAGLVAGSAVGPGAAYMEVFHFVLLVSFLSYTLALWQNTIWYKRAISTTLKSTFDGVVYSLLTAGAFGWLWPS